MGNKISGTLFHSSVFVSRGFCSGRELPFPRALVGCHGGRRKPLVSRSGWLSLSENGNEKTKQRERERNEKKRVRKEKRKEDRKGGKRSWALWKQCRGEFVPRIGESSKRKADALALKTEKRKECAGLTETHSCGAGCSPQ